MIQPRYTVEQRYDKKHNLTRYHVIQQAGVTIADFASLTDAAVTARYLNQDSVTYQERKIALAALKTADGYNTAVYPYPATIDATIPEPYQKGQKTMDDLKGKLCAMNYVINDTQTNIGTLQTQYFLNEIPTDADIQDIKDHYSEIRRLLEVCNVTLSTGRYQATEGEGMKG